ncbi:NAD-dependent protein deacylase [bacterium BMS3Abin05]|nr:NAD-dependent protein deacylase [bacterium BMS3Abin05]GBE26285.1 NAD-dependent protein deacylase [bacterium BMS3Bbin03]HDL78591.1 NAD-dependent deacylase [Bacteroidota bacterium]HDZ11745.1 NAD-dependent deacylase [Bacteroidota bacterium]
MKKISDIWLNRFKTASSVAVLTGAGISAESGVPTFRGEDGLWKKFRPEELANFDAFLKNPELVWEWYNYRRKLIEEVKPNPGHFALAELEKRVHSFSLITQNVDDLHRKAGSQNIIELHGNILRNRCLSCGRVSGSADMDFSEGVPKCPQCGGRLRPDVVWFGEMLPEEAIQKAYAAAETCDIFMVLGTSAVVYPASALPEIAFRKGAFIVEINPEATPVTAYAHVSLRGKTGELLPEIVRKLTAGTEND